MTNRMALLAVCAIVIAAAAIGGAILSRSAGAAPFGAFTPDPPQAAALQTLAAGVDAVNHPITYQGILLDEDGAYLTSSNVTLHFAIYDSVDANASLWGEKQRVFLDDGLFTVVLGLAERIPPEIFHNNPQVWMGVRVDRQPELRPRTRLTYAPFAMHAVTAGEVIKPQPNPLSVAMLHWHEANSSNITVELRQRPKAMGFDGSHIWVAAASNASSKTDEVFKVDPQTERIVFDFDVGLDPSAVAFDGRKIWIASRGDNSITRMRTDGRERETLPQKELRGKLVHDDQALRQPVALAFDGTYMWVVNTASNNVMRMRAHHQFSKQVPLDRIRELERELDDDDDLSARDPDRLSTSERAEIQEEIDYNRDLLRSVLDTISVGSNPSAIAFDGAVMWVLHSGTNNVTRIRASDGEVLGTTKIGRGRDDIVFDGTYMWVADSRHNTVSRVRADTLEDAGSFIVGRDPKSIVFDGRNIWVANSAGNNVTILRASDGKKLGNYPTGETPLDLVFDGVNVWAANYDDKNIMQK